MSDSIFSTRRIKTGPKCLFILTLMMLGVFAYRRFVAADTWCGTPESCAAEAGRIEGVVGVSHFPGAPPIRSRGHYAVQVRTSDGDDRWISLAGWKLGFYRDTPYGQWYVDRQTRWVGYCERAAAIHYQ